MVACRLSDATTLAMLGMTLLKPMGWVTSAPAAGNWAASQHVQAEVLKQQLEALLACLKKGLPQQRLGHALGTRDVQPQQLLRPDGLLAFQPKAVVAGASMPNHANHCACLAWPPHASGQCSPTIMNGLAEIMPSPSLGSGCRTLWDPPSLALIFRAKLLVYCRCFLGSRGRSAATQHAHNSSSCGPRGPRSRKRLKSRLWRTGDQSGREWHAQAGAGTKTACRSTLQLGASPSAGEQVACKDRVGCTCARSIC